MKSAFTPILPVGEAPGSFKGYRVPPDIICYAVWLHYRFPLSLRMVEELFAARRIELTYETVRCWVTTFGLSIAKQIRATAPGRGDKWHLDEVVVTINGRKHWPWRAVDRRGTRVLVQRHLRHGSSQTVDAKVAQTPWPPARDGDRQATRPRTRNWG
ncbi:DDE-type integrase/transposase/recombinase [Burkholderia cepacia]|uniref:DDE-type integrase/transposase/recombinase n=1 Tax=Burkholderia cepacia TaxID=292 RepID=UPI0022AA02AA|nr:DDE-type integrase/transposase/recombinase [Burkholderia cepacia]